MSGASGGALIGEEVFLVEDASPQWVHQTLSFSYLILARFQRRRYAVLRNRRGIVHPMGVNRPNDSLPKSDRTREGGEDFYWEMKGTQRQQQQQWRRGRKTRLLGGRSRRRRRRKKKLFRSKMEHLGDSRGCVCGGGLLFSFSKAEVKKQRILRPPTRLPTYEASSLRSPTTT